MTTSKTNDISHMMRIAFPAILLVAALRPAIVCHPNDADALTLHHRAPTSPPQIHHTDGLQHHGSHLARGLDSEGWTQFEPSEDTNIIYVSSSEGSNYNSGLNSDAPVRTLTRAYAQLRHGHPDWMLLKRGDTFENERLSNGRDGRWQKSGRSAEEPMLIGSYGDHPDRPKVLTGTEPAFRLSGGGNTPSSVDHIAIVGIQMIAHKHDGQSSRPSGISINWQTENFLVEDCRIERYEKNISISAPTGKQSRNVIIRRNVIIDAFHKTANAQGYWNGYRTYDVLIEENFVDNNGGKWPNTHKHNLYINGPSVTVRRNVITNGSSHGLQLRHNTPPPEGEHVRKYAVENLFSRNSLALLVNGQGRDDPNGYIEVRGNVILDGKDITPERPRGAGIDLTNIASGIVIDNIIANNTKSTRNWKVIDMDSGGIGVHNIIIRDNIAWRWPGYLGLRGDDPGKFSNIAIERNTIQNPDSERRVIHFSCEQTSLSAITHAADNNFYNGAPEDQRASIGGRRCGIDDWARLANNQPAASFPITDYPDPDRTLATYAAAIGLGDTHDAFVKAAREQQKGSGVGIPAKAETWNQQLTATAVIDYIRAGFAVEAISDGQRAAPREVDDEPTDSES